MLDIKYNIKEEEHGSFINGRCGKIITEEDNFVGYIGEINPVVLNNFGIDVPCSGLEMSIDRLNMMHRTITSLKVV